MLTKKELRSNIKKFYFYAIFRNLGFFMPVIVLFWQENWLSMTEIMILQSIYSIMSVSLEVPTGYFADLYGRRKSLIIASLMSFTGFFIYSLTHGFWEFLLAESFLALGFALMSGADSAMFYDSLKELGEIHKFKKLWGNIFFVGLIALGISTIIGGFIGEYSYRLTFAAMCPALLVNCWISYRLKEPDIHKRIFKKGYLHQMKVIFKQAFRRKKLRWLLIYGAVVHALLSGILWLYQPYFQDIGIPVVYFGFVFASLNLVAAIGSKYAHNIEEKLGDRWSIIGIIPFLAIGYFLMANVIFIWSFIFAYFQQLIRGYLKPVMADHINKYTKSEIRATVLSIFSMMQRITYAIYLPLFGYITDVYSMIQAIQVLAWSTLGIGIVLIIFMWKNKAI